MLFADDVLCSHLDCCKFEKHLFLRSSFEWQLSRWFSLRINFSAQFLFCYFLFLSLVVWLFAILWWLQDSPCQLSNEMNAFNFALSKCVQFSTVLFNLLIWILKKNISFFFTQCYQWATSEWCLPLNLELIICWSFPIERIFVWSESNRRVASLC